MSGALPPSPPAARAARIGSPAPDQPKALHPLLFGAVDDVVLQAARKGGEQCAVPRDADDEVFVIFGVFLRVEQRFARNDVELHMAALLIKIRADKRHKVFKSLSAAQCRRMEFLVEEGAVVTVDGSTIESNVTVIDFSNTVDIYISKENRNALYSVNVSIKPAPKWRLLATSDNVTSGNFTMAISPDNIPYIATTVEVEVNVTDPDSGGQSVDTKEYPVLYRIESSFENALTAQYFFEEDAGAPSMSFDTEGTPYVAFSDERAENGEISVFKVDNGTATQIGASGVIYTSDGGDSFPIFYIADNDIYLAIHNGQKNVTVTRRALNLVHFDGAQWQNGVSLPGQDPSKASLKVLGQTVNGVHYIFAVDRSDPYAADIYKYDTVNGNTWENVAASLKPIAADGSTELGFTNLYCTAEFNVDNDGNIYFVTGANFVSADAFNPAVVRYNPGTKTQNIIGSVFTNISNDRYAMFKIAFDNNKLYITSRTKNHLAIIDYDTNGLIAEIEITAKPVDMLAFGNNLFILGGKIIQ